MKPFKLFGLIVLVILATGVYASFTNSKPTTQQPAQPIQEPITNNINTDQNSMTAIFTTNKGIIKIELLSDQAPNTVANFEKLVSEHFYDGTRFHRVIADFMIQGGDPLSKDVANKTVWGTGGPGYQFADEITDANHNLIGTIAMANAGPNTNGSQFFINVADNDFLDTKHTVFGRVIEGMDVVNAISITPTDQNDRPLDDVIVESITIASE